jgi:hypothetical protein
MPAKLYVGFEVNSPGLVYPTADADVFVPWFEAERNHKGEVILDRQGRATVRNANGDLYRRSQVRVLTGVRDNLRPGAYVPYTQAQTAALAKVLLWLKRRYPRTFRLEYVFGHDEVSPGRKVDPGGSLRSAGGPELTMKQFRADLLAPVERATGDRLSWCRRGFQLAPLSIARSAPRLKVEVPATSCSVRHRCTPARGSQGLRRSEMAWARAALLPCSSEPCVRRSSRPSDYQLEPREREPL